MLDSVRRVEVSVGRRNGVLWWRGGVGVSGVIGVYVTSSFFKAHVQTIVFSCGCTKNEFPSF